MANLRVVQEVECDNCGTVVEFTEDDIVMESSHGVSYVKQCPNVECGLYAEWTDEGDG